jgi:hypothetical protein
MPATDSGGRQAQTPIVNVAEDFMACTCLSTLPSQQTKRGIDEAILTMLTKCWLAKLVGRDHFRDVGVHVTEERCEHVELRVCAMMFMDSWIPYSRKCIDT